MPVTIEGQQYILNIYGNTISYPPLITESIKPMHQFSIEFYTQRAIRKTDLSQESAFNAARRRQETLDLLAEELNKYEDRLRQKKQKKQLKPSPDSDDEKWKQQVEKAKKEDKEEEEREALGKN